MDLFEHKNKIMTNLTKLDENCDQKGILTFKKRLENSTTKTRLYYVK